MRSQCFSCRKGASGILLYHTEDAPQSINMPGREAITRGSSELGSRGSNLNRSSPAEQRGHHKEQKRRFNVNTAASSLYFGRFHSEVFL